MENVSALAPVDVEGCRRIFPEGLDPHFLWVTAAGNSGRRFTAESPLSRCPQTFSGAENLLVVAAAEGRALWPYADAGPRFAELGADCVGRRRSCAGSSEASPRVASLAALLIQQHGDRISNAMARMSILLGADVPSPALPVRSGGVLHAEDARRAAGLIIQRGLGLRRSITPSEARSLLEALYPDAAYAEQKHRLLEANGAFIP